MTMKQAIAENLNSGDKLFLGGAQHGAPSAAVHEIVRQKIDHLTVIALLSNTNLLISEGLTDKLLTGFTVMDEKRSYVIRRAKEMNKLPIFEEYSHYGIALALFAGYLGVPFMPTRSHLGSDMPKYNESITTFESPFSGGQLCAIKAFVPDVGILHVQRSDIEGNAQKWGTLGVDHEGVNASKRVIITTEKIVDSEVIQRDPNRTIIPGFRVSAVVEQPWGAYPVHLAGCYTDGPNVFGAMADKESYDEYMKEAVHAVKDWNEYLDNLKETNGEDFFDKLRIQNPAMSEPIITGY
jgi:glutaconate CoA-transferase subunit A